MGKILENLLLLALPASGKSETRKYLASIDRKILEEEFHLGPTVQLDDFPYVHMMRRIDDELAALGSGRIFFHSPEKPFIEGESWGVLIHLINDDYHDMISRKKTSVEHAALHLLKRLDAAREKMGKAPFFFRDDAPSYPAETWKKLLESLESDSRDLINAKNEEIPETIEGKTILIEFARGGADGSTMPIPWGYQNNLKLLSPEILEKAAILYVWVTPEDSRRKNAERTDPNDPGSILNHGVPIEVLMKEYGCDDIDYLLNISGREGYVKIEKAGKTYFVPLQKFDNRADKTSFIRNKTWDAEHVKDLHNGLKTGFQGLFAKYEKSGALS